MGLIDWRYGVKVENWKVGWKWMLLCFLLSALSFQPLKAQTWSEWFRQKKTQEKYLLKQVAYLKLYAGQLKKGYELVSGGLQTIRGITSREMDFHEAFFASLKMAGPLVRGDVRGVQTVEMALRISKVTGLLERSGLDVGSKAYVVAVCGELRLACAKDLDELLLIVGTSGLEMEEGERFSRLAAVHGAMSDKLEFSLALLAEVRWMEGARENERSGLERLRRLYGRD